MAIIENASTEAGDILRIKTETPVLGLIALTQFVDTTNGEILTDYFRKEFRYSLDGGLTYSNWIELNLSNISNVPVSKFDLFVIEYQYTRVGNTPEVTLSFDDILVSGEIEDLPYLQYKNSFFQKFFNINDLNVFGWALNVLEKLYTKGLILPDYVERNLNQSNLEDEDFIVFWNSITHFFAIIVYFARQFHNFESSEIMIEAFLRSKGVTIPRDATLIDLLYLYGSTPSNESHTYIDEFIKRGTSSILDQGGDIDGELINLINHNIYEELIFALFRNFENGWCLGKSSPLWKGTEKIINIIKGYEYTEDVQSLYSYPLLEQAYISLVDGKIKISSVPAATLSGVGGDTKKIIVDHEHAYEISFRVSQSIKETNLVFGCRVWDKDDNELVFKNIETLSDTNYFFYQKELNLVDTEYWVRGVLYNNSLDLLTDSHQLKTNIGLGNNLRLPSLAAKIVPIIGVLGTGSANNVLIDNIKIRPMKLNFSRGQLGVHNLIYLLTPNNNTSLSEAQIELFIKEHLLPYNSFLKTNWL